MKSHDVQGVTLPVSAQTAFRFIASPENTTKWAQAFASIDGDTALLRTPNGEVRVGLAVFADETTGTIDWKMTFPDGTVAMAFSRVVPLDAETCAYSFVLTPPPVPMEQIEGTIEEQSRQLREELQTLKNVLQAPAPTV